LESFARSKQGKYAAFDPVCPEQAQRDVAVTNDDIATISGVQAKSTSTYRELLPRYGLERSDQLRALICEGNSLLAWVGGFRADAFRDEDPEHFDELLPFLRHRLLLERRALRAQLTSAVLPIAMEALVAPAFIVAESGRILEANSLGQQWLAHDAMAASFTLREAVRGAGQEVGFEVARIEFGSARPAYFVWRRNPPPGAMGAADERACRRGLTPRQRTAMRLLALGLSNKALATEMGCAQKTVEVHVSAVLKKAHASSRAELLAKIFGVAAGKM
jgi:DNA-binding CsgD family transcriptional regulator